MRFVIVTGMSGAGKSSVLKILEDHGYNCIDNMPVPLLPKLADWLYQEGANEPGINQDITGQNTEQKEVDKIALGIDIRSGKHLEEVSQILDDWKSAGLEFELLFLESSDKVLVKRYKETRRNHPLSGDRRVEYSIEQERIRLQNIKKRATCIIDTSKMLIRELNTEIKRIFVKNEEYKNLYITILSFGFKNGIPVDADLVFDVRFLPNPYYIEEMRKKTGNDSIVRSYVMSNDKSQQFLSKLIDMMDFLSPNYILEGKNQLIVAIGCTGGMHRSVTLANELYDELKKQNLYGVRIEHRDIQRESIVKEV